MRAGLLSDPKVIARLNKQFVCTSMIIDDLEKPAAAGNALAKTLIAEWEYPVEMVLLTPKGKVVSKLNSFKDFPGMHRDVSAPPGKPHRPLRPGETHSDRFLEHLDRSFPKE